MILVGLLLLTGGGILIRSAFLTPPDPRLVFNRIFLGQPYPAGPKGPGAGKGGGFIGSPGGIIGGGGGGGGGGAW